MAGKPPLIVMTAKRAYEFTDATYSLDDEGFLHIERVTGPNGSKRVELALFNEFQAVFWTNGIEAIEVLDDEDSEARPVEED